MADDSAVEQDEGKEGATDLAKTDAIEQVATADKHVVKADEQLATADEQVAEAVETREFRRTPTRGSLLLKFQSR